MATPEWCKESELRDGASHPSGNPDIYNRPLRTIFEMFTNEHNFSDGTHANTGLLVCETGTYTGNAADDRIISLTNSNLDIFFLLIWRADTTYPVFASTDMTADDTKELGTAAFQADQIQDISVTGQFEIGQDATVNANTIEYYYLAIGTE